jgi:hypothetical protein
VLLPFLSDLKKAFLLMSRVQPDEAGGTGSGKREESGDCRPA